jgi:hypothetical protein
MNFLSHHIRSLLFEDRIDSGGELSRQPHNGFSRRPIARMAPGNRAVKLSKLSVLTDGRLDQLASQSSISSTRDLTACNPLPTRVFAGSQADKARQLADVADLLRMPILARRRLATISPIPGHISLNYCRIRLNRLLKRLIASLHSIASLRRQTV